MKYLLALAACVLSFLAVFKFCKALLPALANLKRRSLKSRRITLDELLNDRLTCFALFAACGCLLCAMLSFWALPFCLIAAYVLSGKAPAWMRHHKKLKQKAACEGQLDIMADIIAMGTRAGLGFDAALELFCSKFKTPLSREMEAALSQWQSGIRTRSEALHDITQKLESKYFARFEKTVINAIAQGSPLADMLARFAGDVRRERSVEIEQQVEKAPVKMLIPMGTCILPAMLILVMGPVLLQFMTSGL